MGEIEFFNNISLLVFAGIVAAIVLAFVLVVVIFSVKFKSHQEKNRELIERLDGKIEKVKLLEESLSEVRILNASQLQEIGQNDDAKAKLQEHIDRLTKELESINEKLESSRLQIITLEKEKSELGANATNAKEALLKSEEALAVASKRNEFWVEQMAELRVKYDALRLKIK